MVINVISRYPNYEKNMIFMFLPLNLISIRVRVDLEIAIELALTIEMKNYVGHAVTCHQAIDDISQLIERNLEEEEEKMSYLSTPSVLHLFA